MPRKVARKAGKARKSPSRKIGRKGPQNPGKDPVKIGQKEPKNPARPGIAKMLSEHFGTKVTPQQVGNWRKQGLPVDDAEAMETVLAMEPRSPIGEDKDLKAELLKAQIAKTQIEAKLKQVALDREKRVLVLASAVKTDLQVLGAMFKGGWLQAPSELTPMVAGMTEKEIFPKIQRYCEKQLSGVQKEIEKLLADV